MQKVLDKIENLKLSKKDEDKKDQSPHSNGNAKHKNGLKKPKKKQKRKAEKNDKLGVITPFTHKTDWNDEQFELSAQPKLKNANKHLWLIRHGERVDEVQNNEYTQWRKICRDVSLFDPPLTTNGFKQARDRGRLLKFELDQIENDEDRPKCIYTSPTLRTLGTAMEIAKVTKLPIVVIPGLSACAAAVKRGKLIKMKMSEKLQLDSKQQNNDDDDNSGSNQIKIKVTLPISGDLDGDSAKSQNVANGHEDESKDDVSSSSKNESIKKETEDTESPPKKEEELKNDGVLGLDESEHDDDDESTNDIGDTEERKVGDDIIQSHHPMFDTFKGTAEYELFLESYGWIGQCEFMTKAEVLEEFGKDGVKIYFDYRHVERFRVSLERLVEEAESNIILCVTHREGIRKIDGRLRRTNIPYCAHAKYGVIPQKSMKALDKFHFLYYESR